LFQLLFPNRGGIEQRRRSPIVGTSFGSGHEAQAVRRTPSKILNHLNRSKKIVKSDTINKEKIKLKKVCSNSQLPKKTLDIKMIECKTFIVIFDKRNCTIQLIFPAKEQDKQKLLK
jgi:hypothetical protein